MFLQVVTGRDATGPTACENPQELASAAHSLAPACKCIVTYRPFLYGVRDKMHALGVYLFRVVDLHL